MTTDYYRQWPKTALRRQFIFMTLTAGPAVLAAFLMAQTLPGRGDNPLEIAIIVVFAILFGGIAQGFWLSFFGLITLARRADPGAVSRLLKNEAGRPDQTPLSGHPTAVLVPICQEDIVRVMAAVAAIYESLDRTGQLPHFEFFILSDSRSPDLWVEEEMVWAAFTEKLGAAGRLHYRRRRVNLKRKSGNIADFCRRWGADFEFMIVLDADSVMSGRTLVDLVRLMIKRPEAGLIQTVPVAAMKTSPLARLQQFCGQAYGPLFSAGLNWLLLGGAIFWGHNAIIRIRPFMEHCGLPRLSGLAPLGGDIMSHDFVESALLKRAGWEVWLAYDLEGSYEEVP
ncbi:MAG: glucans biosynthesis glucosyltransferase MdoH, partial [Candidatus Adiutrix sp.]|nr:glucans biosynthesis glucosyltransferase MdoH [Candidatus Adiutrix sp.]